MKFKITYKNPETGEDESVIITEKNCHDSLSAIFAKLIPDGRIKPVNVKLELIFGTE